MYKKIIFVAFVLFVATGAGCISLSGTASGTLGMFRSSDKGETWQAISSFPTVQGVKSLSGVKVYRVFTDPSDQNALYLASRGQGLFYSYDKGTSWQAPNVFGKSYIYGVAVDPTNKCVIYVTDGVSIYKTIDCLRTWTTVDSESSKDKINALSIDFGNNQIIYASLESGGLLMSANSGMSWQKIHDFKVKIYNVETDHFVPGRVYVASAASGLFRSDDDGATWVNASQGLQNFSGGLYFYRLAQDPTRQDSLYWLSQYGIFHSTDAGNSWTDLKLVTSPGSINIYTFAINPKNAKEMYYTGTIYGSNNTVASSKLYKSTDGGNTWFNRKLPSSAIPVMLLAHPDDQNTLFVGFTSAE
jgi:photosystem II stability/assembly factor-like uncharacterized protein